MEWKTVTAEQFCTRVTDGTHDSPKRQEVGRYLITSKHLSGSDIDFSSAYKISEEDYQKIIVRSNVEQYDILFSMIGTIGNTYRVTEEAVDYAVKNMAIFKFGGNKGDSSWFYYWLKSPQAQAYISQMQAGSTQGYLTLATLRSFPVAVPDHATQDKIVAILSSLDDKIENNNRINRNLEAQALAMYNSWFFKYEPWGGNVPSDWRLGTLSEIGDIIGGSTPSKTRQDYYTDSGIAWLTPKDLSISKAKFTAKGEVDITKEGYASCSVRTMPRGSVIFSSRAPIGYLTIAKNEICTNQGFKSVVPKLAGTAFIYCYLKCATPEIENKATGSTFKEASGSLMKSLQLMIPSKEVLESFENSIHPLFDEQERLEDENKRLATLRDTLLPKLMKGEIAL